MDLKGLTLPFPEGEIDWRIAQAGKKQNGQIWANCLAYVQARAIMNRLDEVCGPGAWRVDYSMVPSSNGIDAGVICRLSIKIGDEWVTKEDGAEQTDIESFKGGISSALKRAGSVWGIGRYLYELDTGFAQIVPQGTKDAKWGQTKDKAEFYWVPPKLPQWALPKGEVAVAQLPRIKPEAPAVGDGTARLGYVIPYGQLAQTFMEDVAKSEEKIALLREFIDERKESYKKSNRPYGAWFIELLKQAEPVIKALENSEPGSTG